MKNNGGRPVPTIFPIVGFPGIPDAAVQAFFGLNAAIRTEDLDLVMEDLAEKIPKGVLPIACTDGYDFVCIDLRTDPERVVLWDRAQFWGSEEWNENDLYLVVETLDNFLTSLRDDSPAC